MPKLPEGGWDLPLLGDEWSRIVMKGDAYYHRTHPPKGLKGMVQALCGAYGPIVLGCDWENRSPCEECYPQRNPTDHHRSN